MKIDIVVPIYNAYEQTTKCLVSLESYQGTNTNIILINDASTDPKIKSLVDQYAIKNNWNFIHHKNNCGFVKTANQGLKLSNNHTLLLNSDTVVTKPWLYALQKAVRSGQEVGTVTPWSNNAEICSFPKFLSNNPVPENANILAEDIYKNYQPKYPLIPTAVGFCMLITKKAKQIVGYFDEELFGHGYGEENDYSMRVVESGLINILCDNAYVVHIGNQSFSDFGLKPDENSMKRLLSKHPKYQDSIQQYINKDPLAEIRHNILKVIGPS